MKSKRIMSSALLVVLLFCLAINASASTTTGTAATWGNGNSTTHPWKPYSGSITPTFYDITGQDYVKTYLSFTLSSVNVTAIKAFNNGTSTHKASWKGKVAYFGMDITNVPSNEDYGYDMMDAYSISTDLPNPVIDIENDDWFGSRNEEAEVVALGTVTNTSYYMSVLWDDYRTGANDDNGKWVINSQMSELGVSDYNVLQPSSDGSAWCQEKTYGKNSGNVSGEI
jgi:hypothetical protein